MRRMKLAAGLLAVIALLTACGAQDPADSTDNGPDLTANATKTLRVVVPSISAYLGNPFQAVSPPRAETTSAIFDALTRVSEKGEPSPWLATSWKRLDDTTWQFTLRDDVTFSNGEKFNADSVVASVAGLVGPAGTGAVARLFLPDIAGATKVDEYTVNITTKASNGVLPQQVAALYVVPPKYWAEAGPDEFAKAPVGTGPYTVTSISTTEINLKANFDSWRKPIVGAVEIKQVADPGARTNAILSGQADINTGLDIDRVDSIGNEGFTVLPLQNQGVYLLQFINTSGTPSPLDKKEVRQAINYAVNKEAVLKSVFQGLASIASQGVAPGVAGYEESVKPYPYDPEKAKQLLAAAGYPNGVELTAVYSLGAFTGDRQILEAAQSDLAAVGIKLNLNQDTTANMTSYLLKGQWPANMFSTSYLAAPTQDATKAYFTNSCLRSPGSWCDREQADLLVLAGSQTLGSPERADTLAKLARAVNENPPGLFLFNQVKIIAYSNKVAGYSIDTSTNVAWENIYFK